MNDDTVFALASGAGRAAIAVLRISGPDSARLLTALCGSLPLPRRAVVRALHDREGDVLDRAMVLWLPGPGSYTGEDSAELHLHAGRAVVDAVAAALGSLGARPAEPGEFTRRAFLNGKLDLVSAEAVHDLVAAETDAQRRQALRQLDGALGDLYRDWSGRLRGALAQQEALIDFPDEDLPPEVEADLLASVRSLRAEIAAHLDDHRRGERLREGLFFAITGAPNVGKSSLINALAERDVAIVSATPGTTRDAIETRIVLGGVPVTLIDTAGLREATDPIEAEGVRRALSRAASADLVITVVEAGTAIEPAATGLVVANKSDLVTEQSCAPSYQPGSALTLSHDTTVASSSGLTRGSARTEPVPDMMAPASRHEMPGSDPGTTNDRAARHSVGPLALPSATPTAASLIVADKSCHDADQPPSALLISALTGAGLPELRARLAAEAVALTQSSGPAPLTRARHRLALQDAAGALRDAESAHEPELRGEAMRLALRALGSITGHVGVEDILDSIFRQFCIGK